MVNNWEHLVVRKNTKKRIKGEVLNELLRVRPHLRNINLSYDAIINEVLDSWLRL